MHFTLADLIADIAQNGVESGAELVEVEFIETEDLRNKRELRFLVRDNGKGMDQDELERAKDPFFTDGIKHPHRKVGLGLPFLIQTAVQSDGGWEIKSEKGKGTQVSAWFDVENVDLPPVGDIPGLFRTILLFTGPKEILIHRRKIRLNEAGRGLLSGKEGLDYEVSKTGLIDALGSFDDAGSLILLNQYLNSLEEED